MSELKAKQEAQDINLGPIEKELTENIPNIFNGVPKKQKEIILRTFVSMKSHSGPIPDPETLRSYSEIIPDGANRIMKMAENQSEHRIKIESKVISGQLMDSRLGQIFAFIIALLFLGCSTYCIMNDHDIAGGILGGTTIVGLVATFIKGRSAMRSDLNEKKMKIK